MCIANAGAVVHVLLGDYGHSCYSALVLLLHVLCGGYRHCYSALVPFLHVLRVFAQCLESSFLMLESFASGFTVCCDLAYYSEFKQMVSSSPSDLIPGMEWQFVGFTVTLSIISLLVVPCLVHSFSIQCAGAVSLVSVSRIIHRTTRNCVTTWTIASATGTGITGASVTGGGSWRH
jgi:hypothetical protein